MTQNTQTVSPLRQRMIEDMMLRKLSPKTQSGYILAVKKILRITWGILQLPPQQKICVVSSCIWSARVSRVSR
jgi:hypothetical protein